jgi:hypothetical protein
MSSNFYIKIEREERYEAKEWLRAHSHINHIMMTCLAQSPVEDGKEADIGPEYHVMIKTEILAITNLIP